ncbi:MAG TPA: LLM class flavin-dependent oxidoreductase [Mycobacterium sp.]|jgi:alkanesulfonate monooxygenase SsuD/methylene tetrahydromethanopterin reductase-like flavin-dependent oxidoreductase (luciferase family)|nr:LLM class flavin-dependent oxidoreductase [Mycobacterium sp.]
MYTMRFDMRSPESGAPTPELYAAALEMCAWAETRGAVMVVLSEHHATSDGHLPSPLLLASAIAARTSVLNVLVAAAVLPFYHPVRLAEDMAVLDNLSRGRVHYAFGIGHRAEEYEHMGIDSRRRGKIADDSIALLLRLLAGDPVEVDGRRVHVTPPPATKGGPRITIAGGSAAAAKRAGRHGLGFIAFANTPELKEIFESESRAHGHEPGVAQVPDGRSPTAVFVADDIDTAWTDIGPYLLHDARMAAAYRRGDESVASITRAETVDELRSARGPYTVMTLDDAVAQIRSGAGLQLHPLCGGMPPELAWPYLERAAVATARARGEG